MTMPRNASQSDTALDSSESSNRYLGGGAEINVGSDQAAESANDATPTGSLTHSTTRPLASFVKLLAVVFVVSFYVGSAHRTVGHQKDFFSQWTLARLAVEGHGAGIYNPELQRRIARDFAPPGKLDFRSDFYDRVGVSPYPPIMALLYAPLGWLAPQTAQWCMVQLAVVLALVTAWTIARMTHGRIGFSTALLAVCCFPGFFYNVALGQNAAITLALFAVGLMALANNRLRAAGATWGVLAYKVHWVAVVGWIPFALGRNKAYVGLAVSLVVLASAATLVFGWEVWAAWLVRVRAIAAFYGENPVQLGMACDLRAAAVRYLPAAFAVPTGWALLWIVGTISWWQFCRTSKGALAANADEGCADDRATNQSHTVDATGGFATGATGSLLPVSITRQAAFGPTSRPWHGVRAFYGRIQSNEHVDPTGPAACVLLFGAGLAAPYMMYYDVTVFVLPLLLLWSHRGVMTRAQITVLAVLTLAYYAALPVMDHWPQRWQGPPWATLIVLGLWGVSLWVAQTCRSAPRAELAADLTH